MGNHYLPRYYLKGFSKNSGKTIWVYEKQKDKFASQVKSVANINQFYSNEVEKHLANDVEMPANAVLEKIREQKVVSPEEKRVLAKYIVAMMKRVPKGKQRTKSLLPQVTAELAKEYDQELSILAEEQPQNIEIIKSRITEISRLLDKYSKEMPVNIWLDNISPSKAPRVVETMNKMTWRFLTYDQKPAFLTSDDPVFYFTNIGIGKPESEITFPLSSHVALWASWRSDLAEGYFSTNIQAVKEINRRTAYNAERFLYHCEDENWILPFFEKKMRHLNRLY